MKKVPKNAFPRLVCNSTGDLDRYLGLTEHSAPASGLWSGWSGLVAYWNLDEASGTRVDSINGYDLTDNNSVGSATGMKNLAASFTALNAEYLSRAGDVWPHPSSGSSSVSLWIKTTAVGASGVVGQYNASADGILVWVNPPNISFLAISSAGQEFADFGAVTNGSWHHAVVTYDATTGEGNGYLDGGIATLCFTKAAAGFGSSWADNFEVGQFSLNFLIGTVDEVAIWNRVLTADERTALYNAGAGRFYPN